MLVRLIPKRLLLLGAVEEFLGVLLHLNLHHVTINRVFLKLALDFFYPLQLVFGYGKA